LIDFIKVKKDFNIKDIIELLCQLNNTFKLMNENKIAHRDLKLTNILVKYENKEKTKYTFKITDYGVSKEFLRLSSRFSTKVGTVNFMAPEVLSEKRYNYECDLWSLGVIIYLLYFKNYPYLGMNENALLNQINNLGKKILKSSGNKNFDDLIRGLLASNPNERLTWDKYFNHPFFENKPFSEQKSKNEINIELRERNLDIIEKIKNDEKMKYKNEINLIYFSEEEEVKDIFGVKFVYKNKDNIELKINGIKNCLIDKYKLKKGDNIITLILKKDLTDLSYMFTKCYSLKNIEELKFLNTSNVKDFSYMFSNNKKHEEIHPISFKTFNSKRQYMLSDINPLKNWNVSKGISFESMFRGNANLSDIKALENWDVSNCENFSDMFCSCYSLSNINPLKYWNVSKGKNFSGIFSWCSLLSNIKPLENWDVSNGKRFYHMFLDCDSLSNIEPLEKWNVSNGTDFYSMFYHCKLLSDINPLKNWNVSNGKDFSEMFRGCKLVSDLKPLKNWNVSNGTNFSKMFYNCELISDINPLKNWNVSNGNNFLGMFYGCKLISKKNILNNWKISKNQFVEIFKDDD